MVAGYAHHNWMFAWMFAHRGGKSCCRGSVLRASQRDAGLADAARGDAQAGAPSVLRDGLRTWQALLAAVAGGLGLAAAFPPVGIWPLAVVGPALLAVALWRRSLRGSFLVGLVFGLAFFVPLLSWVVNVAWYAWAGLAGADTVLFAVLALGQRLLLRLRRLAARRGRVVGGGRVAARPVAVRRLPVGAAGHEPGGRADRALGRGRRARTC